MRYDAPETLRDAVALRAQGGALVIAGGTDWYPALGDAPNRAPILDVSRVAEFGAIEQVKGHWRIGAAVTWSALIRADLPPCFDGLKAAAREVGSVQIQNAGTLVGNLCNASPAADGVPPLLTLEAQVELVSARGVRVLALEEFLQGVRQIALAEDELVSAILVPKLPPQSLSNFTKLGARKYLVISISMVAVVLELESDRIRKARVAVGACSAVAQRLPALEAALVGVTLASLEGIVTAADFAPLSPITDVRASAEYRQNAARELVLRALSEMLKGEAV